MPGKWCVRPWHWSCRNISSGPSAPHITPPFNRMRLIFSAFECLETANLSQDPLIKTAVGLLRHKCRRVPLGLDQSRSLVESFRVQTGMKSSADCIWYAQQLNRPHPPVNLIWMNFYPMKTAGLRMHTTRLNRITEFVKLSQYACDFIFPYLKAYYVFSFCIFWRSAV